MSDPTPPVSSTYELCPPPAEVFSERVAAQRYWLHALLLAGTLLTMLVVGARMYDNFVNGFATFPGGDLVLYEYVRLRIFHNPAELLNGMSFALTLIVILLCHEMGHYFYCVHYGVDATLPFFIPFTAPIGTLGAFIRIRSGIRSRAALFDIGIAGPIAGFIASCVVLVFALPLSRPLGSAPVEIEMGTPLIFKLASGALGFLGIGVPVGLGLKNVAFHPAAIAAWVGMFATSLNLLPGGQLDGGHIVYSLVPRAHRWISRLSVIALVMMMWFWWGWAIWAVVLHFSGSRHPQVAPWPDISPRRRWISLVALLLLVLTFIPQPFRITDKSEFPGGAGGYIQPLIQQILHH